MQTTKQVGVPSAEKRGAEADLREIVMGLHWDRPQDGVDVAPTDLDALCVLFDSRGGVLEVIHPGHSRSADDSIVHTGDSRTGASLWDDERIFVFLDALPPAVSGLAFVVVNPSGRPIDEARGATCHISDRVSERELVRLELTSLCGRSIHVVATVQCGVMGWRVTTDVQIVQADLLEELQALSSRAKADLAR